MSLVSFVEVKSESGPRKAIEDSLDLIEYKLPSSIKNIVIKPNLCYYWDYTTGQTTDPNFVAALIELIREQISTDVNVSVVESDASAMKCRHAFRMLGYEKMVHRYDNVRLVNLSEDEGEKIEVKARDMNFNFTLPKTIQNADLRVNVPKIKYMSRTKISCALKNIYGCNPFPEKFKYHSKLAEAVVALNKIMKFDLNLLDGVIVAGSEPRRLNLVMTSRDSVAFDAAISRISGVDPESVRHIMLAQQEGLGTMSFTSRGLPLDFFGKKYPKQKFTYKALSTAYKLAVRVGLLKTDMI